MDWEFGFVRAITLRILGRGGAFLSNTAMSSSIAERADRGGACGTGAAGGGVAPELDGVDVVCV